MYIYLRGLAVSNLCVLVAAVPALRDISHGLPGGHYLTAFYQAHFKIPLINAFMSSSVYIIMCMTVNRFCSMWKPDLFRRYHTWSTAVISISTCFVFGLLLHIPLCLQNTVVETTKEGNNSDVNFDWAENEQVTESYLFKAYIILSEILLRFGPILVLAVLNPLIIIKFREVSRRKSMLKGGNNTISLTSDNFSASVRVKPGTSIVEALVPVPSMRRRVGSNAANGQSGLNVSSEERVLALVLVSVILLFVVCTTPAAILSLIYSVKLNHNLQFQWFRAVANNLELLNFTLNFYIYCLCSSDIRTAFLDLFTSMGLCCSPAKPEPPQNKTSATS